MELCSICLDDIIPGKNVLVTECGHTFHCSCLMTNTAHNGYGCPYCRTEMASIPDDETISDSDEESIYSSDDDSDDEHYDDNVLTSFRMFHQRIGSDDIEAEPIIFDEPITTDTNPPSVEYISNILIRQGVNVKDLVGSSTLYNSSAHTPTPWLHVPSVLVVGTCTISSLNKGLYLISDFSEK